ncbi:MAG: GIY-YIG nuclease family protein [Bacteroides sp.]|nr:GIY-YIG nuclease family protein [Ruminococcus flavefaciens]MCM1554667.1 GIY-YIG nuclease family protein [Bacteroides sp.]
MNNKEKGYVYILTNPSFKEDWVKIGKSSRPVDVRSKELDNTAVPLPFDIFATIQTCKYNEVEKLVHKMIDRLTDLRIRQNREFFNVSPQMALEIFKDIESTIDDAEVTLYHENKPIRKDTDVIPRQREVKRPRFKFSMCGIKIGELVTFIPTGTVVKVATDDAVEYDGRIYKLSPFVGTFMPEDKRNTSGAYQGAKYFSYKGTVLADLRNENESLSENPNSDNE